MINRALRLIRTFHDMRQNDLAEKLGISKSYISELEKGTKSPSIEIINRYSAVFGITASSILFFSESLDNKKYSPRGLTAKRIISEKVITFLQFVEARRREDAEEDED